MSVKLSMGEIQVLTLDYEIETLNLLSRLAQLSRLDSDRWDETERRCCIALLSKRLPFMAKLHRLELTHTYNNWESILANFRSNHA